MAFRVLVLIICLMQPALLISKEIEGMWGASYTKYTATEVNVERSGLSGRTKINFYNAGKGLVANVDARGINFFLSDFYLGYGAKSSGSMFFEASAGGMYSAIWGPGLGVILSTGFKMGSKWFVSFPLTYRLGTYVIWGPNFGFTF